MTIQIVKGDHSIETYNHVTSVKASGDDGFLSFGYSDDDGKHQGKEYGSGQWISFHFSALTVGGY